MTTLRALVDAGDEVALGQLGGRAGEHWCSAPYVYGQNECWPKAASMNGQAYVALNISGGFCTTVETPQVYLVGARLEVRVSFASVANCRVNGVLALPSASLIGFDVRSLKAGLYGVEYVFDTNGDVYRSAETYLSVPSPQAVDQAAMEGEAVAAVNQTMNLRQDTLFSVTRVAGSALAGVCGGSVPGAVYLVTYVALQARAASPGYSRSMRVAAAGAMTRECSSTPM